jgi:hypothetical protein
MNIEHGTRNLKRISNIEHGTRNFEVKRGGQPPQSPQVGRKGAMPELLTLNL